MHYYQHHIGDFIRDTAQLNDHQLATYLRLIWIYYDTESPISGELEDIAFAVRSDEKTVGLILRHYFNSSADGWVHTRCDREISEYKARVEKARKKANARWSNATAMPQHSHSNATAVPQHEKTLIPDANQEPITNNQRKEKDDVPTVHGDLPAADPPCAEVIQIETGKQKLPHLPFEQLVDLYHQRLPMCPRVQLLTEQRRRFAAARWKAWAAMDGWETQDQGLGEWGAFFDLVGKSRFLTGKAQGHDSGRPPFVADFDWLMRPTNFQKVFEGRYSEQRIAR